MDMAWTEAKGHQWVFSSIRSAKKNQEIGGGGGVGCRGRDKPRINAYSIMWVRAATKYRVWPEGLCIQDGEQAICVHLSVQSRLFPLAVRATQMCIKHSDCWSREVVPQRICRRRVWLARFIIERKPPLNLSFPSIHVYFFQSTFLPRLGWEDVSVCASRLQFA